MIEAIFMTLIGLTCLWAAHYCARLRRRVNAWPGVRGRITERKAIRPTDRGRLSTPGFRWSPEVLFAYRVGDQDFVGDKIWLPWSWTNTRKKAEAFVAAIPDEVNVRYDPADPQTSCLYAPPFSNVLWYALPGVVLVSIGVLWLVVKLLLMV